MGAPSFTRPASLFVIQWVNCIALVLSIVVLGLGILLATKHGNCERLMAKPVLITGAFIMCVSLIGFLGALKEVSLLLWAYLFLMCLLLGALAGFTILAFIVTNHGAASGRHSKEPGAQDYRLEDYSGWLQKLLNDTDNWEHLKSCFVKPKYCSDLKLKYRTLRAYKHAALSPIESACCRPPSQCGYPPKNASYYDLQSTPLSSRKDCKLYRNSIAIKCYNCDSCKGVIAHYLRKEWRIVALVNIIIFTMLIVLYSIAYFARNVPHKFKSTNV